MNSKDMQLCIIWIILSFYIALESQHAIALESQHAIYETFKGLLLLTLFLYRIISKLMS